MRIRIKESNGIQRDLTIRTWREFSRFVEQHKQDGRRISVEPSAGVFHVTVHRD